MINLRDANSNGRNNNLNGIRLILALAVILSHSFLLCLGDEPLVVATAGQLSMGVVAVNLFFLISGMLITASWLRSSSMQSFLLKRILRIYPAFILAMGFSGLIVWTCCPAFRAEVGHGISWGIKFMQDCLFLSFNSLAWKGIFADNPYPLLANGSLWTIQKEFACYLLVAAIGMFGLFKHRAILLVVTAGFYLLFCLYSLTERIDVGPDLRLLTYFLVGVNAWLWRDKISLSKKWLCVCLVILAIGVFNKPWLSIAFPLLGGYSMLWLAYAIRIPILNWTKSLDLSYGVYLFAWPVQQVLVMRGAIDPWLNFLLATPLVLGLAWLSWNLVEKRFLALKGFRASDYDPAERDLLPAIESEGVVSPEETVACNG